MAKIINQLRGVSMFKKVSGFTDSLAVEKHDLSLINSNTDFRTDGKSRSEARKIKRSSLHKIAIDGGNSDFTEK